MNDSDRLSLCSSNTPTAEHLGPVLTYDGGTDWRSFQPSLGPGVSYQVAPGHTGDPTGAGAPIHANQNPKVPISKSTNRTSAIGDRAGRAGRACEHCHQRKYKCSGHQPTCQRCQVAGVRCVYGDRKREKVAKQVKNLMAQVHTYETLLQEVCSELDPVSAQHIRRVLNRHKTPNERSSALPPSPPSSLSSETSDTRIASRTPDVQRSLLGPLDYAGEDYNRGKRVQSIGFVGGHSETTWIYRLKRLMKDSRSLVPAQNGDRHSVSSMAYFVDEKDISVMVDVDVSQLPPRSIGDQLVNRYFRIVHPSFPIIGKAAFWGQYRLLRTTTAWPGRKWLAILNLVFAVATRYMHHEYSDRKSSPPDSLVYFSRAWKLLTSHTVLDTPDLQQVQIEGLTSFYLLSVGQINRSWRTCGVSICSAVAMGLNLRNESDAITHVSKETRYRVWWSLYTLDILLSVITGRPPRSNSDFCTTPLPLPFKEDDWSDKNVAALIADYSARSIFIKGLSESAGESTGEIPTWDDSDLRDLNEQREQVNLEDGIRSLTPNTSLYFLHFIELALIMRQSIDALYAANTMQKLWCEIETDIHGLIHRTDAWLSKLPPAFHFTQGTRVFESQSSSLAFSFYSTKILITLPCLSRVTEQPARMGRRPGLFCDAMAALCVDLAADMLNLLPDVPDMTWMHDVSPWWCILHYLMQSIAVLQADLMLKESADTAKFERGRQQISKASRWLGKMSAVDAASQRAFLICTELLACLDSRLGTQQGRNVL